MFDPQEPESPSLVRWVAQLLGSAFVPLFVALGTAGRVIPESTFLGYLTIVVSSAGLAVIVYLLNPVFVMEGTIVWIFPVTLEILAAVYGLSVGESLTTLLYGESEGSWAMVLLTFPVLGTCVYSLTMRAVHRRLGGVV